MRLRPVAVIQSTPPRVNRSRCHQHWGPRCGPQSPSSRERRPAARRSMPTPTSPPPLPSCVSNDASEKLEFKAPGASVRTPVTPPKAPAEAGPAEATDDPYRSSFTDPAKRRYPCPLPHAVSSDTVAVDQRHPPRQRLYSRARSGIGGMTSCRGPPPGCCNGQREEQDRDPP
jgi:hypothetical protein